MLLKRVCGLIAVAGLVMGVDLVDAAEGRTVASAPATQLDDEAVDVRLAQLKTGDTARRLSAIEALGRLRSVRAVPALAALALPEPPSTAPEEPQSAPASRPTESPEARQLREAATRALVRIPHPASLEVLRRGLLAEEPAAPGLLLEANETFARAGMPGLAEEAAAMLVIVDQRLTVPQRCALHRAVARVGHKDAATYLLMEAVNEDPQIRACALQAMVVAAGTDATLEMARQMSAAEPGLKAELLKVLGQRGAYMEDVEAVELIAQAVADPDEPVHQAAVQAIRRAAINGAMPVLRKMTTSAPSRAAAERALQELRDLPPSQPASMPAE